MTHTNTLLPALSFARQGIDAHILGTMFNSYIPEFGRSESFFHLRAFVTEDLPREAVRGFLRDLTDKGLCHFRAGLFTEDGEVAGAGYGITNKGIEYYLQLSGEERPESIADWYKRTKGKSQV